MSINKKKVEAVHDLPAFQALLKQGFYRGPFIMPAPAAKPLHRVSIAALMAQTIIDFTTSRTENSLGNYSQLNTCISKGN